MGEETLSLFITDKTLIADNVCRLDLARTDATPLPSWEPGAHIEIDLASGMRRAYSLCGDPTDREKYVIAVLRDGASRGGSVRVHDVLQPGDTVHVHPPRNDFPLVDADRYLFLAGGIGITPMMPMIARAAERGIDWRLHYGGRDRSSMAFLDNLEARYGSRVRPYVEAAQYSLPVEQILQEATAGTAIYGCGPVPMLDALEARHDTTRGTSLHIERFRGRGPAPAAPPQGYEVVAARTGTAVRVQPGCSVLQALRSAGIVLPSSCEEGICGTCESRVLEGVPDHRDSFLTDQERSSNLTMLVCVSGCLSERIVLDV